MIYPRTGTSRDENVVRFSNVLPPTRAAAEFSRKFSKPFFLRTNFYFFTPTVLVLFDLIFTAIMIIIIYHVMIIMFGGVGVGVGVVIYMYY